MTLRWIGLALLGALFVGCTGSHTGEEDAGGIIFDPRFADAGVDAGPPPSTVGSACVDDTSCVAPESCITDWPEGYCTSDCTAGEACPEGTFCVQANPMTSICLAGCDPSAGGDQCRPGYGCAGTGGDGVCVPGCEEDADCGGGLTCYPDENGGECRNADAMIGSACTMSTDCGPDQRCLSERRWGFPGGTCGLLFVDCDPDTDVGCPDGAACVEFSFGMGGTAGVCIDACDTGADCTRSGYECTTRPGRSSYCGPAFDGTNLGAACSTGRNPCTGGVCLSEGEYGYPDSMCVDTGCDPVAQTGCPSNGVCVDVGGTGVCHPACASGTGCRPGYACQPAIPGTTGGPTACQPGCADNMVCANAGYECNLGTGLCRPAFAMASLGEPCVSDDPDCVGGACLSEAGSGWPAGTCTYPGCRLSGTGPGATCPTGSVCVDDGGGDPTLGVCVNGCTMPTDCRPGYTCGAGGGCVPACTATDCGTGRTCNTTSGLCE